MNFVVPKLVRSGDDLLMPSDMCISIYIIYIHDYIYIHTGFPKQIQIWVNIQSPFDSLPSLLAHLPVLMDIYPIPYLYTAG